MGWHIHFYKNYGHRIWEADTSRGFDLLATNKAGTNNVTTLKLSDFEKLYNSFSAWAMIINLVQQDLEKTSTKFRLTWKLLMTP